MDTTPQSAVVVEDDPRIRELLRTYLEDEGFEVVAHEAGDLAWEALRQTVEADATPDVVLLDLMLPGMDGVDVCRRLRAISDVPILMVSARDDEADRILGLQLGADDYVTKPFSPAELVARVHAVLRRDAMARRRAEAADTTLRIGTLTVDTAGRTVHVGDDEVELTSREFDLLAFLVRRRGVALTRDEIVASVWGHEFIEPRNVDVHVKEIRRKLADAAPISTVWGVGYKAVEPG